MYMNLKPNKQDNIFEHIIGVHSPTPPPPPKLLGPPLNLASPQN